MIQWKRKGEVATQTIARTAIEGTEVLETLDVPRACALLMLLIYDWNTTHKKCWWEPWWEMLLKLDGMKPWIFTHLLRLNCEFIGSNEITYCSFRGCSNVGIELYTQSPQYRWGAHTIWSTSVQYTTISQGAQTTADSGHEVESRPWMTYEQSPSENLHNTDCNWKSFQVNRVNKQLTDINLKLPQSVTSIFLSQVFWNECLNMQMRHYFEVRCDKFRRNLCRKSGKHT